jgi:hypothetical protein
MNFWGCHPHGFCFEPNQKLLPAPPNFEKDIALAFLKAALLQIPHWVHFTFKVQNPMYMFTSIKEISDWMGFHYQSETLIMHVIDLEVKILQNPH